MPDITPISKKSATKYFNWRQYFRDMYVSAVRAGTGGILAYSGSNTAEAMAPELLNNIGMSWKQAVVTGISALIFDLVRYVNLHPLPPEESYESYESQ
jgi:hypothetical protein